MRLIIILLISIATFFLGFKVLTNPVYIKGHLRPNPKDSSAYTKRVAVFIKGDNKVLARTLTDIKGNFELTFTPDKEKSFDFFCYGVGIDTILIGSMRAFESDTPELTFYIPALRRRNALGQVICPKCERADKVYEIVYSDGITDHFDNEAINSRHYYKGCIVGPAKNYCGRDKVEF